MIKHSAWVTSGFCCWATWGRSAEREKRDNSSACLFFPMDLFFFQILRLLSFQKMFSHWWNNMVVSSCGYISFPAWWHMGLLAFQKDLALTVTCSQLQHTCQVSPAVWREEVRAASPVYHLCRRQLFSCQIPVQQVQCVCVSGRDSQTKCVKTVLCRVLCKCAHVHADH